jgi:hypothetical protein
MVAGAATEKVSLDAKLTLVAEKKATLDTAKQAALDAKTAWENRDQGQDGTQVNNDLETAKNDRSTERDTA